MRRAVLAVIGCLAGALVLAAAAAAEEIEPIPPTGLSTFERPVRAVVELFTSQGCSSCPPADALLKSYVDNPDIMALSLPVDYWDYIGWKDTLASPKNTLRQRAYSRSIGLGPVYTPQIVVNGILQAPGSDKVEIDKAIDVAAQSFAARRVPVHLWHQKNTIIIQADGAPQGVNIRESTIWLAVVQKMAVVDVKRGENGGRSLTYYNVVREMTPVGVWSGKPKTIQLARTSILYPASEASIVLIQEGDYGPIVGAAWLGM